MGDCSIKLEQLRKSYDLQVIVLGDLIRGGCKSSSSNYLILYFKADLSEKCSERYAGAQPFTTSRVMILKSVRYFTASQCRIIRVGVM